MAITIGYHIVKDSDRCYNIMAATMIVGQIKKMTNHKWRVEMNGADKLMFEHSGFETCVGYVRGIERCHVNNANGIETRLAGINY